MPDQGPRAAAHAGSFYPRDPAEIRAFLSRLPPAPPLPGPFLGGVVPHAGWAYSGSVAGKVWALLAREAPDLLVLFGAVHRMRATPGPGVDRHSAWFSPLGAVPVDQEALSLLLDAGLVASAPGTHQGEHSLEVHIPMVAHFFPSASILPIAMPPLPAAHEAGAAIARCLGILPRTCIAIGSTDLTHYGAHFSFAPAGPGARGVAWARENDLRFLEAAAAFDLAALVPEAGAHHCACGAGAAAAALAFTREKGAAEVLVLEHTDSQAVRPDPAGTYVGYAGLVARAG